MKKTSFIYPPEFVKWADGMLDGEIFNKCQNGYWLMCFLVPHIYTDPDRRKWGVLQKYKKKALQCKIKIAETVLKYCDSTSKKIVSSYLSGRIDIIDYAPIRKVLAGNYADYTVMAMTSAEYFEGVALMANESIKENEGKQSAIEHNKIIADIVRATFKN